MPLGWSLWCSLEILWVLIKDPNVTLCWSFAVFCSSLCIFQSVSVSRFVLYKLSRGDRDRSILFYADATLLICCQCVFAQLYSTVYIYTLHFPLFSSLYQRVMLISFNPSCFVQGILLSLLWDVFIEQVESVGWGKCKLASLIKELLISPCLWFCQCRCFLIGLVINGGYVSSAVVQLCRWSHFSVSHTHTQTHTPPKPFVSVVKHLIAGHLNDILAWF